jgi:tetratricopeptide (TPR) repeat protein
MYRWIYEADIVVADLSTLNANVFYELGVRHAQKPNTTIIIAESVLMSKIPFDLSSFVIHQYRHEGEEIAPQEQERFVTHLAGIQQGILDSWKAARKQDPDAKIEGDSPVFTFLPGMTAPRYQGETTLVPPTYVPPDKRKKRDVREGESLGSIIEAAESAKQSKNFAEAIRLFEKAIATELAGKPATAQDKRPDLFLAQRLALVTYKNGERRDAEGNLDKAVAIAALEEAEKILARYCAPRISTDPETLGLSGAINKRLFELTDDLAYLERAISLYERGFYVKQDYYNGINVAYMYTQRANLLDDRFEAIVSYGHANMIRRKVIEICEEILADEEHFDSRGDKEWVYMTLAECYQGLEMTLEEERLERKIEAEASEFGRDSYLGQKAKLGAAMDEFKAKVQPEALSGASGAAAPKPEASSPSESTTARLVETGARARQLGSKAITIDANLADRPIKSIEVTCKIDYE